MHNMHSSDDCWYLIHCQARKEIYAAHSLQSLLGISVYLPEHNTITRGMVKRNHLFPGYLFIRANLQQTSSSRINTTPGVLRLVEFGGEPARVPHSVIEEISARLQHMNDPKHSSFNIGDNVRVKRGGPLQDLKMIFTGRTTSSQRVSVLLNLLGRLKEVYIDIDELEKIEA